MASKAVKRVSQSAVDWARLASVCPKLQIDTLRNIKTKHDNFVNKVHQLPESLPKIDFAAYKVRLPDPTMADRFKKAYEALSISYPVDKDNLLQMVEVEKEEEDKGIKEFVVGIEKSIQESKTFLSKIESLPKANEVTIEGLIYYFPDMFPDSERPTIWPHHEDYQPYTCKEGHEEKHH